MPKRPILFTTMAFAVIGPLIGALLVVAGDLTFALVGTQRGIPIQDFTVLSLPVIAWAYALGWLPAAAMGLVWGILCVQFKRLSSLTVLGRVITGICLGVAFGAIAGFLWDWSASTSLERTRLIYICIPCSAIAGSLLCVAFPRSIWLQHRPLTIAWSESRV
jgi:hypothetical protein